MPARAARVATAAYPPRMTFSIVARSADGTMHGVAVASKFLAVGAVAPAAEAGVGAVASQAHANLAFRPQALAFLATGTPAAETIAGLVASDGGRDHRQLGVVGTDTAATFTGAECLDWAGGEAGDDFAVQGNLLTGPEVVAGMAAAWRDNPELPFAERLLAALTAGDEAGGDRRGKQSASVYVVGRGLGLGGASDVAVDLRVDDHPEPVAELARLLRVHRLLFDRADPDTLLDLTGELAGEVAALLAAKGFTGEGALDTWAGIENFEERLVPGKIDPLLLEQLRG
ncbi:hypothetical protein Afil01_61050 [Actinorhabdospora filicis]|uniref:Putative peptidoglycan binding domain-containing protein n=2 Tax=Actinorhabdospora filicis TaxID=1785913 RepID=A0A9W6SSK1_9ACTN|nr:hypothetical protein Afil01_61050 [Actinorhabdospora filicis]